VRAGFGNETNGPKPVWFFIELVPAGLETRYRRLKVGGFHILKSGGVRSRPTCGPPLRGTALCLT